MNNIIASLENRYACKKFDATKKLDASKIELLKQTFQLTATSYGLQPIKMMVIENKSLQEQLVPCSFGQRQVADCSHLLVLCAQNDTTSEDINAYFDLEKKIRNTPEEIIHKFRNQLLEIYNGYGPEKRKQSAVCQVYIALGKILTICATEEIDSCPMEGFIAEKVSQVLKLDALNLTPVVMLPIGIHAKDDFLFGTKKVRKPLSELVIEVK